MFKSRVIVPVLIICLVLLCLVAYGFNHKPDNLQVEKLKAASSKAEISKIIVENSNDIKQKIEDAKDGSEVIIKSGVYNIGSPILIQNKKDITLTGEGYVRILADRIDRQIIIIKDSDNVQLTGISACHKKLEDKEKPKQFEKKNGSVLDLENCGRVTVKKCELEGCGVYGIYADNSDEVNILGCYLHHNSYRALGIYNKYKNTNVLLQNSTITNNTGFIEKDDKVNIELEGENIIKDNSDKGYRSGR